ncbi:unnamed protein product [Durusdinium trenchii]|uniref:Uncharacterized protein n=2 Tax=Durusdinium trenchii TaxID=1381693 RepID=A0ABP0QB27_9DINO
MKEQALRNVRILTTMVCLLDLAMLRWHSFIPGLTISALVLMLLEHRRVGQTFRLLESASQEAALCRRCLKIYLLLVDIAFLAAGMSSILVRDRLLDFVFCTLAAGCMLVAVVLYVAMPLPVALEECKHCPGARGLHSGSKPP